MNHGHGASLRMSQVYKTGTMDSSKPANVEECSHQEKEGSPSKKFKHSNKRKKGDPVVSNSQSTCVIQMQSVSQCSTDLSRKPFLEVLKDKVHSLQGHVLANTSSHMNRSALCNVPCFHRAFQPQFYPGYNTIVMRQPLCSQIVASNQQWFHDDVTGSVQSFSSNDFSSTSWQTVENTHHFEPETDDPAIAGRMKLPRVWEYSDMGHRHQSCKQQGMEISVMSYNVLAQNLLENHGSLYRESPSMALAWEYRCEVLLREIAFHNTDIVCLQEVQSDHYENFFTPKLEPLGYLGTYQKRTGDKFDGCAVFYKKDKFSEHKVTPVKYLRGGLMDRDNVALILELVPKSTVYQGSVPKICVANTHLLFNPRRGDVKLGQLMMLFAELDKCARSSADSYCPIILCGDFNTEPHSHLYKFIVRGYLRYCGLLTRLLSGQKEGYYGRDHYMSPEFFCQSFGITDQCQYKETLLERHKKIKQSYFPNNEIVTSQKQSAVDSSLSSPLSEGSSTDQQSLSESDAETDSLPYHTQGSGCLWHRLNFVSTYRHKIARLNYMEDEVTTQHSAAQCTVDYIFYNVLHKEIRTRRNKLFIRNMQEDKLVLLRHYGLMSGTEIVGFGGLPNPVCPSDHLPLIAEFLLKP